MNTQVATRAEVNGSLKDASLALLRDGETLPRLRRVQLAFGEGLRNEHISREIDSLGQ